MARKSKNTKPGKPAFSFLSRKPAKAKSASQPVAWKKVLKAFVLICLPVAICVGFWFLDKWRRQSVPKELTLVSAAAVVAPNPPDWARDEIVPVVRTRAIRTGSTLALDENSAAALLKNLQQFVWLHDVRVQTTDKGFLVDAKYREPIGLVETRTARAYVSTDNVVLDYLPLTTLYIPRITGIAFTTFPPFGETWHREDVVAAVKILESLRKMDQTAATGKPLLSEIAFIDVANLGGRKNQREAHITLKTFDGTEILWGAAMGSTAKFFEADDADKLVQLYGFYREPIRTGQPATLQNRGVRFIDLRKPSQRPRPSPGGNSTAISDPDH